MKRRNLINKILIGAWAMLVMTFTYAGTPLWTYSAPSPATTTVSAGSTATVQYTVINQSTKSKDLILQATPGLSASSCHLATKGSTCALTLTVNGSAVPQEGIHTGPVLCEKGNSLQCYQPSHDNVLQIKIINQPPVTRYTVTSIGDAHVTATPASQQVLSGSTTTFTVTPNAGYTVTVSSTCGGGSLSGTTYTTGAITSNCSVSFSSSLESFTVNASGDAHVTVNAPTSKTVAYGATTTFSVTPTIGYSVLATGCGGTLSGNTYTTGPITAACTVSFTSSQETFTVNASGDAHVTVNAPTSKTVAYGATTTFSVTPTAGYTAAIASDTCNGTLSGTTYTTGAVTSDCAVAFSTLGDFPAAAGPSHVLAVPGNSQVTLSWTAPTNTGTGTITAYAVTYGPTTGTTFINTGCATTGATSCTVTGLTNGTAYTFVVKTTTTLSGAIQIGSPSYSSSVTPTNGLAVSPSTLALSGFGGGVSRILTVTNTSSNLITGISVGTPSPSLPGSASVNTSSANACGNTVTSLAAGASCTITINPGASATSSGGCTASGTVPTASTLNITSSSSLVSAEVVVLGYGCQYQGGYLFSIDDTTSATGSIGGKVAAYQDQALPATTWSPGGALDSIWGIDETSTTAIPSPNASSGEPATLQSAQLNCNGSADGACDSYNMIQFGYGTAITYSAGLCTQPLNNTGVVCNGGATCYTDWYLPAICEMGYDQISSGSGCGIPPVAPTLQNMQSNLVDNGNIGSLTGSYWSSTESSGSPQFNAWVEYFASGSAQFNGNKGIQYGVRCSRALTL
ncbi:MAG: fibronectin type III domain-containing protein [Legionella sp.]|nr:fibronectin type III domain-containing protein [Legionella sp.]